MNYLRPWRVGPLFFQRCYVTTTCFHIDKHNTSKLLQTGNLAYMQHATVKQDVKFGKLMQNKGLRFQHNRNYANVNLNLELNANESATIPVNTELNVLPEVKNGKAQRLPWQLSPRDDITQLKYIYKNLSKFRLTTMVVITTMGGYAMAPGCFELAPFLMCTLGTGFISAAANSVNQYHEVPFDSQMARTKNRVLVTGLTTPLHAIGFATASTIIGFSMLYCGVNGPAAALGIGNLFLYTMIYTPMKRISITNTWLGSVVGAIPPLIGWVGCTGTLDTGAWILAGLLYSWQFPHFNALSWNLRPDYSRAGYRMMAVTNPQLCRATALRYTVAITALSLMAPPLDVTNYYFGIESLPLNLYFCYLAYRFYEHSDSKSSRKLFKFSLIHLPALMLLFFVNKKKSVKEEANETNEISSPLLDENSVEIQ